MGPRRAMLGTGSYIMERTKKNMARDSLHFGLSCVRLVWLMVESASLVFVTTMSVY